MKWFHWVMWAAIGAVGAWGAYFFFLRGEFLQAGFLVFATVTWMLVQALAGLRRSKDRAEPPERR